MTSTAIPRPASGVALIPVGDEAMLFDQRSQRLFLLNPMASTIWCQINGSRSAGDITEALVQATMISTSMARHFVVDMLKTWRRIGLLHDHSDSYLATREDNPSDAWPAASSADLLAPIDSTRQHYAMLGTVFSLGFSNSALAAVVHPVLAHLSTRTMLEKCHYLDLIEVAGEIRVVHERRIAGRCARLENLAPLLHGLVGLLAIRNCQYLMAIHASGLERNGNALMLAGKSGSGKTTMAAAFAAAGWEYMSDDTMLLLPKTLGTVGVPYSLTVKQGSCPILGPCYPQLEQAPVHVRADDQLVRYLSPRPRDFSQPYPVRWIGFPHRSLAGGTSMRRLERVEGLYRLLQHCCAIPRFLDAEDVRHLARWSADVQFFEFATVDINDAVAEITALVNGDFGDRDVPLLPISGDSLTRHRKSML